MTSQRNPDDGPSQGPGVRFHDVDEAKDGQRIDNLLFNLLKGVPKTHVYRLLRTGQVRINGKRAKPESRVAAGDRVRIPPVRVADRDESARASDRSLAALESAVIFEDRHFIAIDKPAGLAAHGGSGVSLGAIEQLRQARPNDSLELVHRLDRDTSGVLLFARRRSALLGAQSAMREGRALKHYLALVVGRMARDKVRVDVPLRKNLLRGGERIVEVDEEHGKPSRSEFRVLERYEPATYVEVRIETGRTHQIRVHARHMGHPVAGDDRYGDEDADRALKVFGLNRMFLHAARLEFSVEGIGDYSFSAPLPPALSDVLARLPTRK